MSGQFIHTAAFCRPPRSLDSSDVRYNVLWECDCGRRWIYKGTSGWRQRGRRRRLMTKLRKNRSTPTVEDSLREHAGLMALMSLGAWVWIFVIILFLAHFG